MRDPGKLGRTATIENVKKLVKWRKLLRQSRGCRQRQSGGHAKDQEWRM